MVAKETSKKNVAKEQVNFTRSEAVAYFLILIVPLAVGLGIYFERQETVGVKSIKVQKSSQSVKTIATLTLAQQFEEQRLAYINSQENCYKLLRSKGNLIFDSSVVHFDSQGRFTLISSDDRNSCSYQVLYRGGFTSRDSMKQPEWYALSQTITRTYPVATKDGGLMHVPYKWSFEINRQDKTLTSFYSHSEGRGVRKCISSYYELDKDYDTSLREALSSEVFDAFGVLNTKCEWT